MFLLSIFWVQMRAKDNGFDGFDIAVSVECRDELHYLITAGRISKEIDLTEVDRAALLLQQNGRWMFPTEARMAYRIACFTAQQIKDNNKAEREREFFRNAGLV